jgi:hypothetical protein
MVTLRRVLLLTGLLTMLRMVFFGLLVDAPPPPAAEAQWAIPLLLLAGLLDAAVLDWCGTVSGLAGRARGVLQAGLLFGVQGLWTHLESLYFLPLPADMIGRMLLAQGLIAAAFGAGSAWVHRHPGAQAGGLPVPQGTVRWLVWAIGAAGIYLFLYFSFGALAWQSAELREYYRQGQFAGLGPADTPRLAAFQALRGVLWGALALPLIYTSRRTWGRTALAAGAVFSVLIASPLLLPNPFMPAAVRWIHLPEVGASNLLLGLALVGLTRMLAGPVHATR